MSAPHASSDEELFAISTPGLERALADECRALGATAVREVRGGVELRGPPGMHRRANLRLRTATRVLWRIAHLPGTRLEAIEAGLARVSLGPFQVGRAATVTLHLKGSPFARHARVLERAVRQRLRLGEPDGPGALELQLRGDAQGLTFSVDTSGEPLYQRGYRQELSRAPLRETLASGLLLLARYDPSLPLWDPMCGSGTIPIEAAWIATHRAPGAERSFAFERFPSHDAAAWAAEKRGALEAVRPKPNAPIWATDLNAGALGVTRRNARRAAVFEHLKLERMDALKPAAAPPGPAGLVIANVPYGKRVGEGDVSVLYRGLAAALRQRFRGWRAALLYPDDAQSEAALGVPPTAERFALENGGISCTLAVFPVGP